jgi:hypothetical protein
MSAMVNQGRVNCTQQNKSYRQFQDNNFEQCQKLMKQKGKTYTIREALACGKAEVDWGIPDEQLNIMEQVHTTIIMIMLLRDLQNHKAKNQVRKNC